MPWCVTCRTDKPTKEMLRDKHAPDGSGLAEVCRQCGRNPQVMRAVTNKRKLNAYHATRRDLTGAALIASIRAEKKATLATMHLTCRGCKETKPLNDFPLNRYGILMHSALCSDCWAVHPEGKQGLIRERARDFARAMRYKRPQQDLRDQHDRDLYDRFQDRCERDNDLRDHDEFGYSRKDWAALSQVDRETLRKAAIMKELGAL